MSDDIKKAEKQAYETLDALLASRATKLTDEQLAELVAGLREQRGRWLRAKDEGKRTLAKSSGVVTKIKKGELEAQGALDALGDLKVS